MSGKPTTGHVRANRLYPKPLGPCEYCGEREALDRHHVDENPFNNDRSNVKFACRSCHRKIHDKGKTLSEEHKAALLKSLKGKKISLEHRAALSAFHKGKPLSEEHKAAISDALKGRSVSPEHRAKLSEAQKRSHAARRAARAAAETEAHDATA